MHLHSGWEACIWKTEQGCPPLLDELLLKALSPVWGGGTWRLNQETACRLLWFLLAGLEDTPHSLYCVTQAEAIELTRGNF